MESSLPAHAMTNWIGRLSVHQDFFWFVSLLAWTLALLVWWRHPDRRSQWAWLPAVAGATIVSAVIQFGMFSPTLDIFQARLNPGTVSDFRPAAVDPYGLGDALLGVALAGLIAAWGWQLAGCLGRPFARWAALAVAVILWSAHLVFPAAGAWGLALAGWPLAAGLFLVLAPRGGALVGLGLAALIPAFSTVGPLAVATGTLQRLGPPTPMGLLAGVGQLLVGVVVLASLTRTVLARLSTEQRATLGADLRWPVVASVALLIFGVSFGVVTGHDNRREILENRLRTTAAHAAVLDPALLAPLERAEFWAAHVAPADEALHAGPLPPDGAGALRQRLLEEVVSTPFLREARIVVLRDGWLIAALSSEPGRRVEYLRRATPEDYRRWENPLPYYEESPVPEIGYDYYSRAPIVGADGRMLAWFDGVRSEFYLTMERRWRVAPFLFTALGIMLIGFGFGQRRSSREREAALRAAAIAAESNRIKTSFFANVSHELRTPLQSILGYSELLQRDLAGEARQQAQLRALREQGELMTRLVNDLIDLSAAEAGAFQLAPRVVAPVALVVQAVESLRPRAEAKGLALHCAVGATVPEWVWFDDARVRQLVLNLVSNALKFTERGSVRVSLERVTMAEGGASGGGVDARAGGGAAKTGGVATKARAVGADGEEWLQLAVRDTGPGIPPTQQARLFVPFSRLAQTASKEGSGLGLALSAALCQAMGGALRVESDGFNGSLFVATWRLVRAAAPTLATPPAVVAAAGGRVRRVLIVDDNTLVRELFANFLRGQGAEVATAASRAATLAQLAPAGAAASGSGVAVWDAVLLDLALPDGSGAALVPALRAHSPGARILGVSAHAGQAEREQALAAGMDAFLVKPVALDELWQAITGGGEFGTAMATAGAGAGGAGAVGHAAFATPGSVSAPLRAAFARELPGKRAELAAAVAALEWERVRGVAHYLRNSALVVQEAALFDACTGLEEAAVARDREALAAWWPRCERALDAWR